MISRIEVLGRQALRAVDTLGRMTIFLCRAAASALFPPYRAGRIVKQVHFIGVKSLFVIGLTAEIRETESAVDLEGLIGEFIHGSAK